MKVTLYYQNMLLFSVQVAKILEQHTDAAIHHVDYRLVFEINKYESIFEVIPVIEKLRCPPLRLSMAREREGSARVVSVRLAPWGLKVAIQPLGLPPDELQIWALTTQV
jgi:hypothetical protein